MSSIHAGVIFILIQATEGSTSAPSELGQRGKRPAASAESVQLPVAQTFQIGRG
jgi:hypothetical protein